MAFPSADHIAAQAGDFEPQLKNRFLVEIYGLAAGDMDLIVKAHHSVSLPNPTIDPVKIDYGNENRKVAGKVDFADIKLEIRDYVDSKAREAVHAWFKQVYDPTTGKMGYASDYKKTGAILMTGPDGESQRVYDLIGIFPTGLELGSFGMDGAENVQISMTLSCDKATYRGASAA